MEITDLEMRRGRGESDGCAGEWTQAKDRAKVSGRQERLTF